MDKQCPKHFEGKSAPSGNNRRGRFFVVHCHNKEVHRRSGYGNTLLIYDKNSLYVYCRDRACKRWSKVQISFPGISIDFSKAAIIQTLMPKDYHFDTSDASEVIGG